MENNLSVTMWYTMRTVNPRYEEDEVGFKYKDQDYLTATVGV